MKHLNIQAYQAPTMGLGSEELRREQDILAHDLGKLAKLTAHARYLSKMLSQLSVESVRYQLFQLQEALGLWGQLKERLQNIEMVAKSQLWEDAGNLEAKKWGYKLQQWSMALNQSFATIADFFNGSDEHTHALFFQTASVQHFAWTIHQHAHLPPALHLPEQERWQQLFWRWYQKLEITWAPENNVVVGLGATSNQLRSSPWPLRPMRWQQIITQLKPHAEIIAGINEALTKDDVSARLSWWAHSQGFSITTIETLFAATYSQRDFAQECYQLLVSQLPPELQSAIPNQQLVGFFANPAPLPRNEELSFSQAFDLIGGIFSRLGEDCEKFCHYLVEQRQIHWQAVRAGDHHVDVFPYVRPMRTILFCRYDGQVASLLALAAGWMEAYYYWTNRDLPWAILPLSGTHKSLLHHFAYQLVAQEAAGSLSPAQQGALNTRQLLTVVELLLMTGARYEFERQMMEGVDPLSLMVQVHERWFGEQLAPMMADQLFWAHQLRYPLAAGPFHAVEDLLGHLLAHDWVDQFSVGVHAKGTTFLAKWHQYLRSAGPMGPEDLFQRHFQKKLTEIGFWENRLSRLKEQLWQNFGSSYGKN